MNRTAAALLLGLVVVATPAAHAQIVDPIVKDDTLTARIELPGGLAADLTVAFENAVGLTPASLGLSVRKVGLLDLSLLNLIGGVGSIPNAFPVLLSINPPASGGLSFSGVASVSLHTHDLPFVANSPLRLFKSTGGLKFEDVTEDMGMGSYRVRGSSGGFSLFLILVELRPVDTVIAYKLDRLEGLLEAYEADIAPEVYETLEDQLAAARAAWTGGALVTAIESVESFAAAVKGHSGTAIPDVWRSARDLTNAAGYLRAAAGTLRFSLALKSNASGPPL